MKTKVEITVKVGPWLPKMTVPAGTKCVPATNLPGEDWFWVEPWEGMSEEEESILETYGINLTPDEIENGLK